MDREPPLRASFLALQRLHGPAMWPGSIHDHTYRQARKPPGRSHTSFLHALLIARTCALVIKCDQRGESRFFKPAAQVDGPA